MYVCIYIYIYIYIYIRATFVPAEGPACGLGFRSRGSHSRPSGPKIMIYQLSYRRSERERERERESESERERERERAQRLITGHTAV